LFDSVGSLMIIGRFRGNEDDVDIIFMNYTLHLKTTNFLFKPSVNVPFTSGV